MVREGLAGAPMSSGVIVPLRVAHRVDEFREPKARGNVAVTIVGFIRAHRGQRWMVVAGGHNVLLLVRA